MTLRQRFVSPKGVSVAVIGLLAFATFASWTWHDQRPALATGSAAESTSRPLAKGERLESRRLQRPIGRHSARDRPTHSGQSAQRIAAQIAQTIREHALSSPDYRRYLDCRATGSECLSELADLINDATQDDIEQLASFDDIADLRAALTAEGLESQYQALSEVAAFASDPFERAAALALMDERFGFPPRQLPPEVYQQLADRNAAEVALVLQRHAVTTIDDATVAETVADLGLRQDLDSRIARKAIMALGHPATTAQLLRVVEGRELSDPELSALTLAVGRCGMTCQPVVEHMLLRGDERLRKYAYEVLARAPESQRAEMRTLIAKLAPSPRQMSEDERSEYERFLGVDE